MQNLNAACEEYDRAAKKTKPNRPTLHLPCAAAAVDASQPSTSSAASTSAASDVDDKQDEGGGQQPSPTFDIFKRLEELYDEEEVGRSSSDTDDEDTDVSYKSRILEQLVVRERLNTLIVNLYPGNKGYSLAFRALSRTDPNSDDGNIMDNRGETLIKTKQWPYEEDELLRYIDNEELPPYIVDILEQFSYLFYSGCVIAEVRDYRQMYPHFKCDIRHVLLRPTPKSLLADINNLIEDKSEFSSEEKDQLESQLLLANTPDLCLEPDDTIENRLAEIHNRQYLWNAHRFHRMARKFSQVTVNRKRKLDQFTSRQGLDLFDFINRTRSKATAATSAATTTQPPHKLPTTTTSEDLLKPLPVPTLDSPLPTPPSLGVCINEFKTYPQPKHTSDCLPQLIEEYVLETDMPSKDKAQPRVYHIKLSIFQRPSNSEYLGELYLDRDHKKNEHNGVACRFSLGSRINANRYIHQFTEIFTESGRKSARIRYGLSPGYKERVALAQAQTQQAQTQNTSSQPNLAREHLSQLNQALQSQTLMSPVINGTITSNVNVIHQNQGVQSAQSIPILQGHLQNTTEKTQEKLEISALATKLMNSAQQFQAQANAKQAQQQQQQKFISGTNKPALINLLNSPPASNINSDASAAAVNAITNSALAPQRLLARKMTVQNARVLNHNNLIAINNNNRMNLNSQLSSQLSQQQQTITLASVNNGNFTNYTTVPVKQRILNSSSDSGKSAVAALLVGTPAADRPDIVGPNTNSLLLEKLDGAGVTSTQYIQTPKTPQQFVVQSPKSSISPMSSPPPQTAPSNTINVNLAQLQSIPGLQNVQLQLQGFAQPISVLNVSSTGGLQGHPTGLLVSLPVTTATQTSNTITVAGGNASGTSGGFGGGLGTQTMVLASADSSNLAHLVSSSVKNVSQQALRTAGNPQTVSLTQGGQQFQLISQLQRSRQPNNTANLTAANLTTANLTTRSIPGTSIMIKMAAPNSNAALPANVASMQAQLKQVQRQQQACFNQQKNMPGILGRYRKSSASEQQ